MLNEKDQKKLLKKTTQLYNDLAIILEKESEDFCFLENSKKDSEEYQKQCRITMQLCEIAELIDIVCSDLRVM